MNKAEVDALSEQELLSKAVDIARNYGGEQAVKRLSLYTLEMIRNFVLVHGT